ncbi:hypothetical protein Halar_0934 [halophilic archaeon DL31]|nr:hypothetical protein Halar_0934 [halophilic archaeon DL31]
MTQGEGTISVRIVDKVANATDTNVLEQPRLYDAVDSDALDALIEGMAQGKLSFVYAEHEVTVESDGAITLDQHGSDDSTVETDGE